jgi:hypothetical protein
MVVLLYPQIGSMRPSTATIRRGMKASALSAEGTVESMIRQARRTCPSGESLQRPLPRLQRSFALSGFRSERTNPWADNLHIGGIAELNDVNRGSGKEGNLRGLSQTAV